jgi:hypothetical protein
MDRNTFFDNLVDNHKTLTRREKLPKGIYDYAYKKFEVEMLGLYYPYIIILSLTPEDEEEREYLYDYHHDKNGELIHQSIARYGAYEYNFEYDGETYLAIIINQD